MKQKALTTEQEIHEFFNSLGRLCDLYVTPVFEGTTLKRVQMHFIGNNNNKQVEFALDSYCFKCLVPDIQTETVYHTRVKTFPDMQRSGTKEVVNAFEENVKATFGTQIEFERAESQTTSDGVIPSPLCTNKGEQSLNWQ